MERGKGDLSAVQEVQQNWNIPVVTIATLDDLFGFLEGSPAFRHTIPEVRKYRNSYGVKP
jgi:orotate phosphoribosyltransferase